MNRLSVSRAVLMPLLLWALDGGPALAQPAAAPGAGAQAQPAGPSQRQSVPGSAGGQAAPQAARPIWQRSNLFGDIGGLRKFLSARGITLTLTESSEVFGNATGGVRQGALYEGLAQAGLSVDMDKLLGLAGGTFNISSYQIHGRGLSQNNLDNNLNTPSSLEATRGAVLFELWYEQVMLGRKLAIRIGQLAVDQEFMISQYAGAFLNHTFGWPTLPSVDLPFGGPIYPLAAPGIRLKYLARENTTLMAAIFNGDPAGAGRDLPQTHDASGTAFRLGDGIFAIAEAQFGSNQSKDSAGLPGTYKIGAWYNSQRFADQQRSAIGLSLADPAARGTAPLSHRGNYSLYVVADQLVWAKAGTRNAGIGVFGRAMLAPDDRNLINFYADGGVTDKGVIEGRDDDTAGIGVAYARYSDSARKLDAQTARFTGTAYPIRSHETVLEVSYQMQVTPCLQMEPSAQYVFNLDGGVQNPRNQRERLGDAAVFGIRLTVTM